METWLVFEHAVQLNFDRIGRGRELTLMLYVVQAISMVCYNLIVFLNYVLVFVLFNISCFTQ